MLATRVNRRGTDKRGLIFFHNIYRYKELLLMLALPVSFLIVNNYLPMIGIIIAFKDYRFDLGIFKSSWFGLGNF